MEDNLIHTQGTPPLAIEILSPIFNGKTVCDVGCGGGAIMELFMKYGAKKCIGIEQRPELVQQARVKGFEVMEGDINSIELPHADIYYNWTPLPTFLNVVDRIQEGIIICGYMPWANKDLEKYNGIRIIVPGFASSEKDASVFELTIIDKDKVNLSQALNIFKDTYQSSLVIHTGTTWLGKKAQKYPGDAWVYQELIHRLKPDFIIETGTAFGGGALLLSTIANAIGHGTVITIENDRSRFDTVSLSNSNIEKIFGSSTDDSVIKTLQDKIQGKTALVILDSDHSYDHVAKELELYNQFIKSGFYMIVEDTHMEVVQRAVKNFLSTHDEYTVDKECEKFIFTFNPGGFLIKR